MNHCKKVFYFDNNATTFVYNKSVKNVVNNLMHCANPSNKLNFMGKDAANIIDLSRRHIAKLLKVDREGVIFTSGATESNNIAIQGVVHHLLSTTKNKFTILASTIEHSSVLNVFKHFEGDAFSKRIVVKYIGPGQDGLIEPRSVKRELDVAENPLFLSIMHANNETGGINDIESIYMVAKARGAIFHTDATQAVGRVEHINYGKHCDLLTLSAHKFHGLKGCGALCISRRVMNMVDPLFFGGKQELVYRPGTENVTGISTMSMALDLCRKNRKAKNTSLMNKKKWIVSSLRRAVPGITLLGADIDHSLPNTLLLKIPKVDNRILSQVLSDMCVIIGIGSACHLNQASHVLEALKVDRLEFSQVIRISMSDYTTWSECKILVTALKSTITR